MSLQKLKNFTDKDLGRSYTSLPTYTKVDAKVVSIHDGDSCDLVLFRNGRFQRFESRLLGVDAPGLNKDKYNALKSRDFFAWLCLGKDPGNFPRQSPPWSDQQLQDKLNANQELVYAEYGDRGGYGRPLVTLKSTSGSSKSFNSLLMEYGYASKYSRP